MKATTQSFARSHFLQVILFLSLSGISMMARPDVTASVDREYAYEGETITLSVTASNMSTSGQPDFSPLGKDFELFGTSQSSSISIINGKRSDSQTWSIRLRPKKMGEIAIPSIQVGPHSTLPLTVDIKPIPVQTGVQQNQSIFITLEVDSQAQQFFVQQHIPLVVRLYYLDEVTQGMITDPLPESATLERLGDDRKYSAPYNGKSYKVFERRYSVLPEKSGELTIPAVSFRGYLSQQQPQLKNGPGYDPFSRFFDRSPFSTARSPVSVRSEPITLNIASQPDQYTGQQWLPAESLELSDSWTSQPPNFKVGEPVSRTITLTAKGLLASQVQPLELPEDRAFRRYAEPGENETRTDGQTVYAISRRTFTYIPAVAGQQQVPAIEVNWWNVINNRQAKAVLPAWNVQVAADPGQSNNQPNSQPGKKPGDSQTASSAPAAAGNPAEPGNSGGRPDKTAGTVKTGESVGSTALSGVIDSFRQHPYWLAGFVLMVVILWLLRNRNGHVAPASAATAASEPESIPPQGAALAEKQAIEALNQACRINDVRSVAQALLKLAESTWPNAPPRSLGALAERVSSGRQALIDLDRVLYSQPGTPWDAGEISRHFQNGFPRQAGSSQQESILKPLYPE